MNKVYHLIGIGGIGMGTLALLLHKYGHQVSGSDLKHNQMTRMLESQGTKILIGHHQDHVIGSDCVIYSSAIQSTNPEITYALEHGIPIRKRAEMLSELMQEYSSITIAGAHGKTTTSSMIASLLINAELNPTIAVGGWILGQNKESERTAVKGKGEYFVAEVDESDGSFLYFKPKFSIITNMDYEHLDFYGSWEKIVAAYSQFIDNTQSNGKLIVNGDDEELYELVKRHSAPVMTFGLKDHNDVKAESVKYLDFETEFVCIDQSQHRHMVKLKFPGVHNVYNALACLTLAINLNISMEVACASLAQFHGVRRRFQLVGEVEGVRVIDDYAHHPTEIRKTLEAAQRFSKNRLITIFQPHRYTRIQAMMDEFAYSLTLSDYLIVTDIFAASEQPIAGINALSLCKHIQKRTRKPVIYLPRHNLLENILNLVSSGDMIITMGAGDITALAKQIVNYLDKQFVGVSGLEKNIRSATAVECLEPT